MAGMIHKRSVLGHIDKNVHDKTEGFPFGLVSFHSIATLTHTFAEPRPHLTLRAVHSHRMQH